MRPFDPSKFRKNITKNIDGITIGFNDPTTWISTGSYGLNYMISGRFDGGIPLGKVTMIAGEPGSGKSYIASGNVVKNAQEQGIFVVLIDTEHALDETWLQKLGVDTSEDKLMKMEIAMIDDVAKMISNFVSEYKKDYKDEDPENRPKVLFVIDSLGMLLTPTDVEQFEKGDMKGDMGRTAKQLKALVKNCAVMFGSWELGLVCTNHTYASQDMFNPEDKISGGSGPIFAASQVVALKQLKLKEDEEGRKSTDVTGIRSKAKVMKSRYSKPFETVEIKIPYKTGMDPYSGLFDLFVNKGVVTKPSGNKYIYNDKNDNEYKYFEREFRANKDGILDLVMNEWKEGYVKLQEEADEELAEEANEVEPQEGVEETDITVDQTEDQTEEQ